MRVATALFLFFTLVSAGAEDLAGRWEGSIQIPGREFDLIVDLDRTDGKNWTGSIIIPGLDVKGAALTEACGERLGNFICDQERSRERPDRPWRRSKAI